MTDDVDDPFREGLPDFRDPDVNEARDDVMAGAELWRALAQVESYDELWTGVNALSEIDARRALLASVMAAVAAQGRELR